MVHIMNEGYDDEVQVIGSTAKREYDAIGTVPPDPFSISTFFVTPISYN